MTRYFYYVSKSGYESPYAVNYNEFARAWFKENGYTLIEYNPYVNNSISKIVVDE